MAINVLITSRSFSQVSDEPVKILRENNINYKFKEKPGLMEEKDFLEVIDEFDAIIIGADKINGNVLNSSKRLKLICKHGTGVDNIDIEAARKNGIIVTNVPATNSNAVADFTFGLIIDLLRKISDNIISVRNGEWVKTIGVDIYGKTIGIIGFGEIGKRVAKRAIGFDMNVLAYDPYLNGSLNSFSHVKFVDMDLLLRSSDIVTIHVPLNQNTINLIDEDELNKMKKGAFLVNTSRGGIVNESALYEYLKKGHLAGAALDVLKVEPAPKNNPLLTLENVLITSHIASYSKEALNAVSMICAKNVVKFFSGQSPDFIVA
ncbi:hydroxyacid dehydrogenase [Thermoanaerobacteraceae bacterium SP2]|nr:hydroxyacid dehydrogenase [Thermoanaerobacteraceae bacterium SP2]